jgi:hypothetical protein
LFFFALLTTREESLPFIAVETSSATLIKVELTEHPPNSKAIDQQAQELDIALL